jgi:hypothetical protein
MNAFYQLACALVAWSALSLTAQTAALEALSSLPSEAFQLFPGMPPCFTYLRPGIDLTVYSAVLIEHLALLGQTTEQWQLCVTTRQHPLEHHYRARLTQALHELGIAVASVSAPGVMRLRSALVIHTPPQATLAPWLTPHASAINLDRHRALGHYLAQVTTIGQLEDAVNGELLAGSAELRHSPALRACAAPTPAELAERTEQLASGHATRLAHALARAAQKNRP